MLDFDFYNIGSLSDPDMAHGHLAYPIGGDIQEEIYTLELPEFKAHDAAVREFVKYVKRGGRRKPPSRLVMKVKETYMALLTVLQGRVYEQRSSFNRRASIPCLN